MAKQTVCDRCDRVVNGVPHDIPMPSSRTEPPGYTVTTPMRISIPFLTKSKKRRDKDKKDLCPSCLNSLEDWFKEGE